MNTIFKLGAMLALLLCTLLGKAQSQSDKVYDMFSNKKGITSLSFTHEILEPLEFFMDEDTKKVIYKMKRIRFLSYDDQKGELSSDEANDRIVKMMEGASYFIIDPKDLHCDNCDIDWDDDKDGDKLTLIGHGKRSNMDEFHIIITDDNKCFLLSFYGDITVEDLKACNNFRRKSANIVIN